MLLAKRGRPAVRRAAPREAGLPSEGHRFGVLERSITAESTNRYEEEREHEEYQKPPAHMRVVEVELRIGCHLLGRVPAPSSPFEEHPRTDDPESEHHYRWEDYVGQYPEVGVFPV